MKRLVLAGIGLLFLVSVRAQLTLPALVSDSMVLQRNQPVTIWGWSANDAAVTVTFNGKQFKAKPAKDHRWAITLPPMAAGGPYVMNISGGGSQLQVKEIVFGDVWICSGQSNMEFIMQNVTDLFPHDIAQSANNHIREFHVEQAYSFSPAINVKGAWKPANAVNTAKFTAVGYYMARALYEKYKVPIGLIHTSWGGTPIESWMSEPPLRDFGGYTDKINYFKDTANIRAVLAKDQKMADDWFANVNAQDTGLAGKWFEPAAQNQYREQLQVPGFWEDQGRRGLNGAVWVRKEIELSGDRLQQDALLELGAIDNIDYTYFNGQLVGASDNAHINRAYKIPAALLKPGKNVIVVRIIDKDDYGGFITNRKYAFTAGGKSQSLEGSWQLAVGYSAEPFPNAKFTRAFKQPTALYNAMIAPLTAYTIKGVAWYQGEANVGFTAAYKKLLPAMIGDWRAAWQQGEFPFLLVQLANYRRVLPEPAESDWAEIREIQLATAAQVANCGLAVTIDVGEAKDIHPHNKKAVGERLALAAGKLAYHDNKTVHSGPIYQSLHVKDRQVMVSFTNMGGGLRMHGKSLQGFAIAGADKKFVWANARIEKDKIVVWSELVKDPVAVRYAWADNPQGCNLYNAEGLPASPFRTDEWIR